MKSSQRQNGLSMVELLISLAISSFLILGITQVYIDNKRNQVFQLNQMGNLEGSRFAALVIDQYLGKAGYRRNPAALIETSFPNRAAGGDCLEFKLGHTATGLDPDVGEGFCIRYQPQVSGELDCQGSSSSVNYTEAFPDNLSGADQIILAFKYESGGDTDLEKGRLLCKNLNATAPQYSELLSGIADIRLEFGVGNNDALDKKVNTFISQKDWTADSGAIRSIRYNLLLSSGPRLRDSDDSLVLSTWLEGAPDASKTRLQNADNRRIYQIASSTQNLRNLMP
ncbi:MULTISPECIES: PilW family protein [Pseudomonadaceae]|uniref:PilW family protein n=1 Tax=Pseudomonadaceae TaxID=135621 RepID=UPI000BA94C72|nr:MULTISPECIES: PilW family protein [Pseudomonadaceae]MBN7116433.1 pilus assembly protein PilW [Pseudomonas oleovorans]MBN7130750.1 pilus assembly protein PilW [Pseudomonas oleovorans]MBN7141121.1 pilus assembly protein PilW [Pseudomonas oleovorans]MDH1621349.1 PilW family protein [Pseudomonas chengduensis]MDH1683523.1 PilW family protein [Pseudomonas chengduensis]